MGSIVNIDSSSSFETSVLNSSTPVLVDFWAEWCGPCKALAPVLDQVAKDFDGKAQVVKVNVDFNRDLADKYGIRGIPTMILFKGGEIKKTIVGAQPKAEIMASLNELI